MLRLGGGGGGGGGRGAFAGLHVSMFNNLKSPSSLKPATYFADTAEEVVHTSSNVLSSQHFSSTFSHGSSSSLPFLMAAVHHFLDQ